MSCYIYMFSLWYFQVVNIRGPLTPEFEDTLITREEQESFLNELQTNQLALVRFVTYQARYNCDTGYAVLTHSLDFNKATCCVNEPLNSLMYIENHTIYTVQ